MRRSELADLVVEHIYEDYLMVRKGKGLKDRMIPLLPDLADRLHKFNKGKNRNESVFGLKAVSITNKVTIFAKKAGVNIHTHSFRHKYATELIRRGANIRTVQELMGHSNINTTQGYAAVTNTDLIETVKLLQDTEK
jgi:site-specific recombinase XerD